MSGQKIFSQSILSTTKIKMINKILDIILDITNSIQVWAWRLKNSKTRNNRYKKVNNKKIW